MKMKLEYETRTLEFHGIVTLLAISLNSEEACCTYGAGCLTISPPSISSSDARQSETQ